MALYLISYDINSKDSSEYEGLWARLKELRATKILYSVWVIKDRIDQSLAIYRKIAPLIKEKDRLLVQELTDDATFDKLLISDEAFRKLLQYARHLD